MVSADEPRAPAPFIVGTGRCGTTLLRVMLDAHPMLAIPPEAHFIGQVLEASKERGDSRSAFLRAIAQSRNWSNFKTDAAKLSKRKRCTRKKRDFCAGRCCPRSRQCINQACVTSCNAPFQCPPDGPADTECGPDGSCFCGKTPGGKAACVGISFPTNCNDLLVCGDGMRCPAGQVCFTCFCDAGVTPNFRCAPPC